MAKSRNKRSAVVLKRGRPVEGDDQRVFSRFATEGVPVRFKDLKVGDRGEAFCVDIGGGGAGMALRHEIKPRTPLEMWLDVPDGHEALHLLGRVAWSKLDGEFWLAGVVFDRQRLLGLGRFLRLETGQK